MRIAINGLVIDDKPTGVGYYASNLISAILEQNSSRNHIDIYLQRGIFDNELQACPVYRLLEEGKFNSNITRILYEQFIMPVKYFTKGYDLVHFLDYQSALLYSRKRYIATVHDLSYFLFPELFTKGQRYYKRTLAEIAIKNSAAIITDAVSTKLDIMQRFPKVKEESIFVVPLAARPIFGLEMPDEYITQVKTKYSINDDYILFSGTIEPRKNIGTLLQSFAEVLKRVKEPLKLVIVGKKGWLFEGVFSTVVRLRIEQSVVFTDYVSDEELAALYKGAKIFIYPSLYEGFGLPPLEAMSAGVPVIASNVSSIPEVVGDTGILIDPSDNEGLANEIIGLLEDEQKRNMMAVKGKIRAAHFSWQTTMAKTFEVYEKVGC